MGCSCTVMQWFAVHNEGPASQNGPCLAVSSNGLGHWQLKSVLIVHVCSAREKSKMERKWQRKDEGVKRRKGDSGEKRSKRKDCVMWSVGTSATLSLIVFLSQAAPEFTTSLEHEKHSKLNCEAVCLPEMDIYILDSGFFSLKSAFEIVSQHTVVKSLQLHKCMNPFVFLMCLRKSMPQIFF